MTTPSDDASRQTSLTYRKTANVIGNLTYRYDAAGRRTSVGGSLANSGLPQSLATTSYNAANQQTAFGAQTLTYDSAGNLITDGVNTYNWNARNQLSSISGPGLSASFQYDALGRRSGKTINGTATTFLYGGVNAVQEQSGGSPTANLLTGGIDQVLSRSDAAGSVAFMADALGTNIALTDSNGGIQTQYIYEPFGKTTVIGSASSNSFKYTGREDDEIGGYYYRARYYSPSWQRFISEDPADVLGGINLYAYADNDPISFSDPFGLKPAESEPDQGCDCKTSYSECFWNCMRDYNIYSTMKGLGEHFGHPEVGQFMADMTATGTAVSLFNQGSNLIFGRYPRAGLGGQSPAGSPTTWQHRVSGWLGRQLGQPWIGRAGRMLGRVAARASAGMLAAEGGHYAGTGAYCAYRCLDCQNRKNP